MIDEQLKKPKKYRYIYVLPVDVLEDDELVINKALFIKYHNIIQEYTIEQFVELMNQSYGGIEASSYFLATKKRLMI